MNTENKEIDLFKLIVNGIKIILKRKFIVITLFAIGIAYGVFKKDASLDTAENLSKNDDIKYITEFHLRTPVIPNDILGTIVTRSFASNHFETMNHSIENAYLYVSIEDKRKINFDSLINSVNSTIKKNVQFQKAHSFIRAQNEQLLSIVNEEITKASNEKSAGNSKDLLYNKNSSALALISLHEKKLSIEHELFRLNNPLEVIPINVNSISIAKKEKKDELVVTSETSFSQKLKKGILNGIALAIIGIFGILLYQLYLKIKKELKNDINQL